MVDDIEGFFVSYNKAEGKKFKPITRSGAKQAYKLVKRGIKLFRQGKEKAAT